MNSIPSSQRVTIALAGRCNSGKSSLLNAISGQDAAIVSPTAGTTTDPVRKAIEINGIGACTIVDTPGLDDTGTLGDSRVGRARDELGRADIVVALFTPDDIAAARELAAELSSLTVPVIALLSKSDLCADITAATKALSEAVGMPVTAVSALTGDGVPQLIDRLVRAHTGEPDSILGDMVSEGDTVLLVMPQDPQAPKGRLILPQSLTLRELLGRGCQAVCCVPDRLEATLAMIGGHPDLVITDSQVFARVSKIVPEDCPLTSFSILMAAYKGDLQLFVSGAETLARLTPDSRVLIAEACSHKPLNEDIGRVKLPRLLRRKIGEAMSIDIASGNDFPADLSGYDLVIHCGGCMFTRRHVMQRVSRAVAAGVPVTNYGIAIAALTGILPRVTLPTKG